LRAFEDEIGPVILTTANRHLIRKLEALEWTAVQLAAIVV